MNVELTPDQRAFARKAIESGRLNREEEAVQEAMALCEERERRRLEIVAMIDEGCFPGPRRRARIQDRIRHRDYVLLYRIEADDVAILRVLHGSRDLGTTFRE